jgi:hypothetical protein
MQAEERNHSLICSAMQGGERSQQPVCRAMQAEEWNHSLICSAMQGGERSQQPVCRAMQAEEWNTSLDLAKLLLKQQRSFLMLSQPLLLNDYRSFPELQQMLLKRTAVIAMLQK